ncbi:MAG: hypothetical protein MUC95_02980, partial [Spirochaetes bacterium]|nr:hypothetical protein [Spirochaetota bacterium]
MIYKHSLPVKITSILLLLSVISIASTMALDNGRGFKDRLLDFIKSNERKEVESAVIIKKGDDNFSDPDTGTGLVYNSGDWGKFVIEPGYEIETDGSGARIPVLREKEKIDFNSYGSIIFNTTWGKSEFTDDRYRR